MSEVVRKLKRVIGSVTSIVNRVFHIANIKPFSSPSRSRLDWEDAWLHTIFVRGVSFNQVDDVEGVCT